MTTIVAAVACAFLMVVLLLGAAVAGVASAFGLGDSDAAGALAPPAASSPVVGTTGNAADPFPWGQCTWFVAQHHKVTWSGDAADWLRNAAAQGVATASTPSVGAIVVYRRGGPYSAADGHVALVVAVTAATYQVEEMNYLGLGRLDVRTIPWPDPAAEGFIP